MNHRVMFVAGVALFAGVLQAPASDRGQNSCMTTECQPLNDAICPCFTYEEAVRMIVRMGRAPHKGAYYDPAPNEVWLIAAYQLEDGDSWLYSVVDDEDGSNWCSYFDASTGIDRKRQVATEAEIGACAQLIERAVVERRGLGPQLLAGLRTGPE